MALRLDKTVKGVTVGYWKIYQLDVKLGLARIGLFFDKETAKDSENRFDSRVYSWIENTPFTTEAMDQPGNNPIKLAYEKIKIVDADFENAENC